MMVNGGFRAILAAIRQEREYNRQVKEALDRQRREIIRQIGQIEDTKVREEEARRRRFGERVKFCDCGFRRFFGIRKT